MNGLPQRTTLHHQIPSWVKDGSLFFITICALPRGKNQLCYPVVSEPLLKSAEYYHSSGTWWLKVFLLMPDHLHALIAVPTDKSLPAAIRTWKSYQARTLGISWQDGFFDHRLRSDESEDLKAEYIRMNPVRAGLVGRAVDWRHVWPK